NDRDRLAGQLASMNTDLAQTKQQASLLERQLAARGREVETLRVLVAEQEKLLHQPASHKESTGQRASIKPPAPGASQPAVSNQPAGPKSESTTGTAPPAHKPTPLRGSDQLAKLDQTREELVRAFQDDMTKGSMSIQQAGNQLSLSLSSALLFPPGEVTLKPDGMVMLKRIGQVLAQGSDRAIQVTGHTDNQAISKQLKRTFPDNRAWSWARADSARRALISGGTPPDRIRAVGLADTKPLASNTTEAGRQKNRRIEIIVTQFSIPSRTVTSGQGRNGTRMTALSVPDEQDAR
ncbi:MAG TPA: OmpA family protein, partial [Nitrospiraceae bacterium]|nr:OmpA family protein [Nitrospiraceae bacterium]